MNDHEFLALMILLQTIAFAVSFAYLARIARSVSEDTRQITQAVERIAQRLS